MAKIVKVIERVERHSVHNGQRYALLRVATPYAALVADPAIPGESIRILIEPRLGQTIGFEASNSPLRRGGPDYAWTLQKGDRAPGDVVTRNVQEYVIDLLNGSSRIENIATVVVFGDSDAPDWEATIEKAFAAAGYTLANPNVLFQITPTGIVPRRPSPPAIGANDADNDLPY